MRIHNLYADEHGETHFRDLEIEMTEHGPNGSTSGRLPATGTAVAMASEFAAAITRSGSCPASAMDCERFGSLPAL
jgi:hypothetical protein